MADAPSSSSTSNADAFGKFAGIIAVLFLIGALFQALADAVEKVNAVSIWGWIFSLIDPYLSVFHFIAFVLSAGAIVLIAHARHHIERIVKEEREKLYPTAEDGELPFFGTSDTAQMHPRWQRIVEHMASESPGEWRMAILEADIMLEEMLEAMGYAGEGIGERLKQIEKSDFNTLDKAWEAHKVRNQIAHEGADFHLTEREARRIINLYKDVFEEFRYL